MFYERKIGVEEENIIRLFSPSLVRKGTEYNRAPPKRKPRKKTNKGDQIILRIPQTCLVSNFPLVRLLPLPGVKQGSGRGRWNLFLVVRYLLACRNRFAYIFVCVEGRMEGRRREGRRGERDSSPHRPYRPSLLAEEKADASRMEMKTLPASRTTTTPTRQGRRSPYLSSYFHLLFFTNVW